MLLRFTPTLKLLFITVCTLNSFFVIAQTQIDDASSTFSANESESFGWNDGTHTISSDGNEFTVTNNENKSAKYIAKSFGTPAAGSYKVFFTVKNVTAETAVRAFVKLGGTWYKKSSDTTIEPGVPTTVTFNDNTTNSNLLDGNGAFMLDGNTTVSIGINIRKQPSANGGTPVSIIVDDITLQAVAVTTITNTFNNGNGDNKWQIAENWSLNEIPSNVHDVVIPDGELVKITLGNQEAYSVNIGSGATLQINKKQSLTIQSDLTNSGTFQSNLDSEFYPSVIIKGSYVADDKEGTVTPVFRYKSFVAGDVSELKTPAVAITLSELIAQNETMPLLEESANSNHFAIGTYDNVNKTYGTLDGDTDGATILTPGIGYRMRATSGTQGSNTLSMTGIPRTGDIQIPLNFTGDTWNLIGNPYTSAIKVGDFLTENTTLLDDSYYGIYGWDGTSWVTYNNNNGSELIAPTQGFFVAAKSTGNINFTSSMQTTNSTDDFISGRATTANTAIKLNLISASATAKTAVYFNENGTANFDLGYDSARFNEGNNTNLGIYTTYANDFDTTELSIQTLPNTELDETIIPIGIVAPAGVALTINAINNLPYAIYLEDRVKALWHNLSVSDYSFVSQENLSGTGRFFIHTQSEALNNEKKNIENIKLTVTGKTVKIHRTDTSPLSITVYNLKGQLVSRKPLDDHENQFTMNNASGIYLVNLESQSSKTTFKVIIK